VSGSAARVESLRTPRLSLRRPVPADIDAIHAITSDPRTTVHNPADLLTTRADAEELYRRWDQQWHTHGLGYLVIRRRDAAEILGFCGVKVVRFRSREVLNLFYRLTPAAWGDGIASEAATAVVAWAGNVKPDLPIIARVRPDNIASRRIAVRTGLQRAEHLDEEGEDGLDLIFAARWR
jgi:ribosomal-protein-alanine N-acetyltransferase